MEKILSAKEIKDGMTPTPWYAVPYANYINLQTEPYYNEENLLDEEKSPEAPINAEALITAVNNTYGKGLNPESYEDVVKALENAIERLSYLHTSQLVLDFLKEELKKARICIG